MELFSKLIDFPGDWRLLRAKSFYLVHMYIVGIKNVGRVIKIKTTEGPEKEGVCHGFQNWWAFVEYSTLACE